MKQDLNDLMDQVIKTRKALEKAEKRCTKAQEAFDKAIDDRIDQVPLNRIRRPYPGQVNYHGLSR